MSRREKSTILYSRNGIKIEKIDFIDMTKPLNNQNLGVLVRFSFDQILKKKEDKTEIIPAKKAWDEVITRESKLGFYYYETIHHRAEDAKLVVHNKYGAATYKKLVFKFDNKRYEMIYPIKCGDVSINRETRPWDILPGTFGIEDHLITDLYKEVIKFFDICEDEKIGFLGERRYTPRGYENEYIKDTSWINGIRKEVLTDLFGDEKGPTINYNDIKILSHGFDLKQSFRKRKES